MEDVGQCSETMKLLISRNASLEGGINCLTEGIRLLHSKTQTAHDFLDALTRKASVSGEWCAVLNLWFGTVKKIV